MKTCNYCFEAVRNCNCTFYKCSNCRKEITDNEAYEYRGAYSCEKCFEKVQEQRNHERAEIITEEKHKTDRFKSLDLSDSSIGRANREILKRDIEIASKESQRIKEYNKN